MGDAPAAHREAVADLMRRASFDDVEEFIDSLADVSDDGKSALWLYAVAGSGRAASRGARVPGGRRCLIETKFERHLFGPAPLG